MIIQALHRAVEQVFRVAGFASRCKNVGGHTLHYYEANPARGDHTALFIHGLGTSASTWVFTLPRLKIPSRVIAPDLPGFGQSPLSPGAAVPSLLEHLQVLQALVGSTPRTPYSLIGHSLGGWLAMLLALEDPQRVRSLVLLNPAGIWYDGYEHVRSAFNVRSKEDTRRLLNLLWYKFPWYFRPFLRSIHGELLRRRVFDLASTIREEDFVNARLPMLSMPTTIVWGSDDQLLKKETVTTIRHAVPHARVTMIERCGHVPQLECPGQVVKALRIALGREGGACGTGVKRSDGR